MSKSKSIQSCLAIACGALFLSKAGTASAAVVNMDANSASVVLSASWAGGSPTGPGTWVRPFYAGDGDAQGGLGFPYMQAGYWTGTWRAPVVRFMITPGMIPSGEQVTSATYSAFIAFKQGAPGFNLDLSAIGLNTTGFTTADDYGAAGTLIKDDFFAQSASYSFQRVATDATASTTLADYINANYAAASNNGTQTVFLAMRLRMDGPGAEYNTYAMVSDTSWGQPFQLSLVTAPIPEPASMVAMGVAGAAVLGRRRTRRAAK